MKNELLINNIKFWVDSNIVYCKVSQESDIDFSNDSLGSMFCEAVSILSNGMYHPVIFDLQEIKASNSLKLFNILSSNCKIKNNVLSKSFIVKNYSQKMLLSLSALFSDSDVPNVIFKNSDFAIEYCNKNYATFNSISYDH